MYCFQLYCWNKLTYLYKSSLFVSLSYFTWDAHKFPNSVDMINKVAAKGRKMVTIIDPHIKKDDNYFIHKEATEKGYYVKDKNGADYEGWCWPGTCGFSI